MSARDLDVHALMLVLASAAYMGCGPSVVVVGEGVTVDPDAGLPFVPENDAGLVPVPEPDDPLLELGRALFFDKVLSGRRDVSCATCHIVFTQTTEPLPLSIGTGASGLGQTRTRGPSGTVLARNASDLFHRGNPGTTTLLWDGRIEMLDGGVIRAPITLPHGIETLLEAQALLPIFERSEMRGEVGTSELGDVPDTNPEFVFGLVMSRLFEIPAYRVHFSRAFPEVADRGHTIVHVARALAYFENTLWNTFDAPFDTHPPQDPFWNGSLEGVGRALFFGEAGCARCHGGPLFTDQRFHNIGVPQFGPGKDLATGLDEGRFLVTGAPSDRFAFRTPSLRNVFLTAPYMHNGAYASLDRAIRHHFDPSGALAAYTGVGDLPASLVPTVKTEHATRLTILSTLDPDIIPLRPLTSTDIIALGAFLRTLTSAEQQTVHPFSSAPETVPSMLSIDVWPLGTPHPSPFFVP